MRFVNVEIPAYCGEIVSDAVMKYPNLGKLNMDFLFDVIFVIAQGKRQLFRYLCSSYDLAAEASRAYIAGQTTRMSVYESELYKLRLDLIDFANSPFLQTLHTDPMLRLEEKFELVAMILNELLDGASTQMQQQMQQMGKTQQQQSQQGQQGTAQQGSSNGGQQGQLGVTGGFFDGFNYLTSWLHDTHFNGDEGSRQNKSARGGVNSYVDLVKSDYDTQMKINKMVNKLWNHQYLELFQIARNLDLGFERARKGVLKDSAFVSSNITVGKMQRIGEMVKAVPMEMACEDVIDRKIMNKSLKVAKYRERREQKQVVLAGLDCSGSTGHQYRNGLSRLQFIKAFAIALGRKAIRDKSMFYFRWFRGGVKDLFILKDQSQWGSFLSAVLDERDDGNTDVDFVLHTLVRDIEKDVVELDKADILIITDGTQDVANVDEFLEVKRKTGLKFHFLALENLAYDNGIRQMCETYQIAGADEIENLGSWKCDFIKVI